MTAPFPTQPARGLFERSRDLLRWLVPEPYVPQARIGRWDVVCALAMGLAGLVIALLAARQIIPQAYDRFDIFFQADGPRVVSNMLDRMSIDQQRSNVHPLFPLLTWPIANALHVMGLSRVDATLSLIFACALAAPALMFLTLRGMGLPRAVGAVFTGVFLTSACFIHWFAVVETFAFAGVALLAMTFVLTAVSPAKWPVWLIASVATLAFTVTNWTIWLVVAIARLPLRRAIALSAAALAVAGGLAVVQSQVFPHARLFFNPGAALEERHYMTFNNSVWTPRSSLRSEVVTSAVAPKPSVTVWNVGPNNSPHPFVDNQYSPLGSTPPAGLAAIACWLVLLGLGAWGAWRERPQRPVALALGAYLGFQLALHLVYGSLTFLYSAHFLPVMVLLAAFSWFTPARKLALVAAAGFIVLAGISNAEMFSYAVGLTNALALEPPAT